MRIIGGHDYYDGGLAHGRDDAITFLRNGDRRMSSRTMRDDLRLPVAVCGARLGVDADQVRSWRGRHDHRLRGVEHRVDGKAVRHDVSHALVVLCGRLHRGVHVESEEPYGCPKPLGERWIWSAEALRAFAQEHDLHLDEGRNGVDKGWGRSQPDMAVLDLETWFEPVVLDGACRNALVDARITVATMNPLDRPVRGDDGKDLDWRIDQATLRDMGFAKAVDPYTAFQEISMWLGGVIPADGPKTVEIVDNEVKIAKAGFHHPTSFRRAKRDAR